MSNLITRAALALGTLGLASETAAAQTPAATATVIVYRPFKLFGWGINYRLWLSGQEVCRLSNRRMLQLTVPAGPVALRSRYQDFLFKYPERTLALNAEPGQTYYVRADASYWRTVMTLTAVDATTGQKSLQRIPKADHCAEALASLHP